MLEHLEQMKAVEKTALDHCLARSPVVLAARDRHGLGDFFGDIARLSRLATAAIQPT